MDRSNGNRRGGGGQYSNNRGGRSDRPDRPDQRQSRDRSRSPFRGNRQDNTRRRSPIQARSRSPPRGPRPGNARGTSRGGPRGNQQRSRPTHGREIKTDEEQKPEPSTTAPTTNGNHSTREVEDTKDVKMEIPEDETEDETMQRVMGFSSFGSTKNTKVPGNDRNYGVYKVKQTEYRQYMNRVGGFNRPLSPTRR